MTWLVTGAGGQLGSELVAALEHEDGLAVSRQALDVTDQVAVDVVVAASAPDVIINAAAYTAVDAAETDEDAAYLVNATAPALLAVAAARHGARLIHVSTDYVFDGTAEQPYEVDALPAPRSAYGRTKLAGEQAVQLLAPDSYVVRTAWVYGAGGSNFVRTMARLEQERETVDVVSDQWGTPTWSRDLASALVELGRSSADPGVYHCTAGGETTWFGLAQAVFEELGADPARIRPVTSEAFPRPAPRPAYSVLSGRRWVEAGLTPLPHWREALARAFATEGVGR